MELATKFRIYCALERARAPKHLKRFMRLHGNDPALKAFLKLRKALLDAWRRRDAQRVVATV